MKVKVRPLRKEGRLIVSSTQPNTPSVTGVLSVEEKRDHTSGRTLAKARVTGISSGTDTDMLPELLDARLLWAQNEKLRISGFERIGAIEYAQTWAIEVFAC